MATFILQQRLIPKAIIMRKARYQLEERVFCHFRPVVEGRQRVVCLRESLVVEMDGCRRKGQDGIALLEDVDDRNSHDGCKASTPANAERVSK